MCGHLIIKRNLSLLIFFINVVGGCLAWALVRGEPVGQVSRSRKSELPKVKRTCPRRVDEVFSSPRLAFKLS